VSFANPINPGANVNPPILLATVNPGGFAAFPAGGKIPGGPFDVSPFQGVILNVSLGNPVGGMLLSPVFQDNQSRAVTIGSQGAHVRSTGAGVPGATYFYRTLAPSLDVMVITSGAPTCTITLAGVVGNLRFDGPYTPNASGEVLYNGAPGQAIPAYAGPINVACLGSGLNDFFFQIATIDYTGAAGPFVVLNMASDPGTNSASQHVLHRQGLWLPPYICSVAGTAGSVAIWGA